MNKLEQLLQPAIIPTHADKTGTNDHLYQYTENLLEAGITNIEISCITPQTPELIHHLKTQFPGMLIGAGSTIDNKTTRNRIKIANNTIIPTIQELIEAGTDYIVSATTFNQTTYEKNPETIFIPNTTTTQTMIEQLALGASILKFFPATHLGGAEAIKRMTRPLHGPLPIMPSGGVPIHKAPEYIQAGCITISMGKRKLEPLKPRQLKDLGEQLQETRETYFPTWNNWTQ